MQQTELERKLQDLTEFHVPFDIAGLSETDIQVLGKLRDAVYSLMIDFLNIQASGDYTRAQQFLHHYGNNFERLPDEMSKGLDIVRGVPRELLPVFQSA